MSLNKVMLIGNVGKDPEIRYLEGNSPATTGSTKVASFTLATTERYRDRSGETRESTEWHNIVAWRNSADLADKYIRKGTSVYIEGKLRTRSWTDAQGVKKYTTEVVVDNIQLLGKRSDNPASAAAQPQTPYQAPAQPAQPQAPAQPSYNQPAGFQPRQAPDPQPTPIDISVGEGSDDLPF